MRVVLSKQHLDTLDAAWIAQGVPWRDQLRPGVDSGYLDEVTRVLKGTLGAELRLWWGWHNGAEGDVRIASALGVLGVEQAVRMGEELREIALDAAGPDANPDRWWPADALPVFALETYGVLCRGTAADPVIDAAWGQDVQVVYPSLGSLVEALLDAYSTGAQRWNPETARWEGAERFPPDRPRAGAG